MLVWRMHSGEEGEIGEMVGGWWREGRGNEGERERNTHPSLHFSVANSPFIIPTIISSLTSPPASIIFFASIPIHINVQYSHIKHRIRMGDEVGEGEKERGNVDRTTHRVASSSLPATLTYHL